MSSDQPVSTALEARITELEIRLTHQDRLLEELNSVVIEQQDLLDRLRREVGALTQRLAESVPDGEPPPADEFAR